MEPPGTHRFTATVDRRRWLGLAAAVALLGAGCGGGGEPARLPGISVFAGAPGESGSADGAALSARFNSPAGLVFDAAGNLYVADQRNQTIRRITPAGQVSTVAGTPEQDGFADGLGSAARFTLPTDLAIDTAGNLIVADSYNLRVRKIDAAGMVTTIATVPFGQNDGRSAGMVVVGGVTIDGAGNLYVTNGIGTRRITPAGGLTMLEGVERVDGMLGTRLFQPRGATIGPAGTVSLIDLGYGVSRVGPDGALVPLAGTPRVVGAADGTGAAASFANPWALAADAAGNLYVADTGNDMVRKVTPAGVVTTVVGAAGSPLPAGVPDPHGIAVAVNGDLYVTSEHAVLKIVLPAP